ncbi:Exo70 exocyst complex subunit [Rhizopus microsporus ATCC 52813]|uniref:Exocyst complex protein EXO70 n=1 Tax=Rhizopus microsporus ATCC 52813 TaxID=1340429 RepID=A0A2G4T0J5_RHIZD|nr:Exo70 exocyst complex subunit [Rhizopus microsporus ATCC 52813]PHZ14196.1 Exo70 exocyst complex subunit [Rhizopus microsporus ATCC 52813]
MSNTSQYTVFEIIISSFSLSYTTNVKVNLDININSDAAELDALQKQLGRMNGLSNKLVGILDSFDGRLLQLEASILPIHKSTQNLTKLANNIDTALKSTEHIIECLNMPSKEEAFILKGPDENNVLPYLKAMGRLKDGVDVIEKSQLKGCEKTIYQMKQLQKAGMLHLETLFRKWLSSVSNPVDINTMLNSNSELMATASVKQLSQLSIYIASSEKETGYSVDFTKPYIEIRSAFLQKSLHPLSQSVQQSEKHQGASYERGSSEFLKYTECYAKMMESEYKFAQQIMSNETRRAAALKGSITPATSEYVAAGKQLNAIAKRLNYTETAFVFDIIEKYDRECSTYLENLVQLVPLTDVQDMISTFKLTVLRNFYEFMEDIRGRKEVNPQMNLSSDGTVHEMTSNTLNYFKRLYIWRDTVEPLLILIGDGGWNTMPSVDILANASNRMPSGESAMGAALLQKFFVDALDQMTVALQIKSRGYKKPTLATLFLLNNYNHILRQIRSPPLNAIFDEGSEMKFGKLVKKQLDAYQESWKPCVENLMDVTYVRGGSIKSSMGSAERQLIKERFKNFNMEFEEIVRAQQSYAIPDLELRNQVIRDVKNVIVPMYGRFLDKYQNTDFTKNPAKYIRFDKDKIDRMISHLFEPTAY